MGPPLISRVDSSRRDAAVATLTMASAADPVLRWVFPEPEAFLRLFPRFVMAFAGASFERGAADRADETAAVALWLPPGLSSDEDAMVALFDEARGDDGKADRQAVMDQMDAVHPHETHWYLPLIGVEPMALGRGLGSALLQHRTSQLDRDGLPAYLEATTARNRDLYALHGFEVLRVIQAGASPQMWAMLRRPRPTTR